MSCQVMRHVTVMLVWWSPSLLSSSVEQAGYTVALTISVTRFTIVSTAAEEWDIYIYLATLLKVGLLFSNNRLMY